MASCFRFTNLHCSFIASKAMSLWTTIGGFFTGKTVEKITDIADEAIYTNQEKSETDSKFTAEILNNTSVDIVNRWIRPGITIWLIGGFSGLWNLPNTTTLDPVWFQIFMIVITFWFGGRVLLKDLPSAISAILKMKKV